MQVVKVEPFNEESGLFRCRVTLEPREYTARLGKMLNVLAISRDSDAVRVSVELLMTAKDELDAYKRLPELIALGGELCRS